MVLSVSCRSTDSLLREPQMEAAKEKVKDDLLGVWKVEGDLAKSPLNQFKFGYNNRHQFEMRINGRLVQITNLSVIGPLDFSISFKGLDYSELFLIGKFETFDKSVLQLINSDTENQSYELLQNIRLIKQ